MYKDTKKKEYNNFFNYRFPYQKNETPSHDIYKKGRPPLKTCLNRRPQKSEKNSQSKP